MNNFISSFRNKTSGTDIRISGDVILKRHPLSLPRVEAYVVLVQPYVSVPRSTPAPVTHLSLILLWHPVPLRQIWLDCPTYNFRPVRLVCSGHPTVSYPLG